MASFGMKGTPTVNHMVTSSVTSKPLAKVIAISIPVPVTYNEHYTIINIDNIITYKQSTSDKTTIKSISRTIGKRKNRKPSKGMNFMHAQVLYM